MKLQELSAQELKDINGGLLGLGDGNTGITGILEGVIGISHTDEDGNTESTDINFGLGGMLGSMFD
jgi:hypothetical protein